MAHAMEFDFLLNEDRIVAALTERAQAGGCAIRILADVGMPDFELEALCDADEDSDALVERIAKKVKFGPQYRKTVQAAFGL